MPTVTPANLNATQIIGPGPAPAPLVDKQPVTVEEPKAAPAAADTAKPAEDPLAPKLAQLAKKEKQIRQIAREAQAKEESFKAQMAEMESLKAWKAKLTQDPLSVLNEAGIDGDKLTQFILNQGSPQDQALNKLQMEIQALKEAQSKSVEEINKAKTQQYEEAKKQIHHEVTKLVKVDDNYELVRSNQAEPTVVAYIEQVFNETGTLMNIEEATKDVEELLFEKALNIAKLKKVQSKLNPAPPVEDTKKLERTQTQQNQTTLTNRMAPAPTGRISEKERKARAIAAFMGQKL